jgi:hypothetical protein
LQAESHEIANDSNKSREKCFEINNPELVSCSLPQIASCSIYVAAQQTICLPPSTERDSMQLDMH